MDHVRSFEQNRIDHVRRLVNAMYDGLVRTVIAEIKGLPDSCRQSGDDSPLRDVWEEFKYQLQEEQSVFFDAYEDTIRRICEWSVISVVRYVVGQGEWKRAAGESERK